ncbi:MAG: hypothetical protein WCW78_00385 [Candidatus Paceibacterota bacterium]|jgi:hypothetical protein
MPAWQIQTDDFLNRIALSLNEFETQLHLPNVKAVKRIVPLRDITTITSPPIPISTDLLLHLIQRIQTMDGQLPYARARIQMIKIDPRYLKIGQKFIYRENYQKMLENIPNIFQGFLAVNGGLSDLGAYFIFGINGSNEPALACYLPPLVEMHGNDMVITDGIHRNFILKQAGSTLNTVLIENTSVPFPCSIHPWPDIKIVPLLEKPKNIVDRYFDLEQPLFRNLKYLGIDG